MRRSGNHAIIEWLIHSLSGGEDRFVLEKNTLIIRGKVGFINDCANRDLEPYMKKYSAMNMKYVIVNYEDVKTDLSVWETVSQPIVIVRDVINVVASRFKRNWSIMKCDDLFFDTWVENANHPNVLKYESWLEDVNYRNDFINTNFGIKNLDFTSYVPEFGHGSSFVGGNLDSVDNLLSRYNQVDLPFEISKNFERDDVISSRKKLGYI